MTKRTTLLGICVVLLMVAAVTVSLTGAQDATAGSKSQAVTMITLTLTIVIVAINAQHCAG